MGNIGKYLDEVALLVPFFLFPWLLLLISCGSDVCCMQKTMVNYYIIDIASKLHDSVCKTNLIF